MRTYKYRIRPSSQQAKLLWNHSVLLNGVYNKLIALEKESYDSNKTYISYYDLNKELLKFKLNQPELCNIHSQVLQQVSFRVHTAYQLFFKKAVIHPPNFRSCRRFFNITYPQNGYSIRGRTLYTKIYGPIPMVLHRPIQGEIRQISINYTDGYGWSVCITTSYNPPRDHSNTIVALDLGTSNLATTDHGEVIRGPTHQKSYDKRIDTLKTRRDTTCKKGSRRYNHLSKVVRRLHSVKTRKINDSLHKISKDLSSRYDTVVVEQLNLKKMSETEATGRNRIIRNSCISRFTDMLRYKVNRLIEVNPMHTSQVCARCHHKLAKRLGLKHRTFKCPDCGLSVDRDHNAAVNIRQLGLALRDPGCYKQRPRVTIVDLPHVLWACEDTQLCLEQAMA
jgi:putative transposase